MAKIIIIAGKTSTGKSTSYCSLNFPEDGIEIKGVDPKETFLINPVDKELPVPPDAYTPFRIEQVNGKPVIRGNMLSTWDYGTIGETLGIINKNPKIKRVIVEDGQYFLSMDFFNRRGEGGYDKYAKIGYSFIWLIFEVLKKLRNDIIVYLIMHTDEYKEEKELFMKLKTIGKMLDEKFTLEGLFSTVIVAEKRLKGKKLEYVFRLMPSTPNDIAKSTLGVFVDSNNRLLKEIPNDLGIVDESIRKYFKLN